jgi:3-oxoacyl-[acyl-carrier protein] reductase
MEIRFDNKTVLITGASSGIGRACAGEFARSGAKVIVNYNASKDDAESLVKELKDGGHEAIAIKADVTREEEVKEMVKESVAAYGGIDILINNAGALIKRAGIGEVESSLLDQVFDLNLKSVFIVTREVLPFLKKSRSGKIINVSSIAGRSGGGPGAAHYASAKGAIITFTKNLAKELAPFNILVNAVAPGVIDTRFHQGLTSPEMKEKFKEQIPLKREGEAREIAWPVMFLASEYATFIVGETLEINGGQLMD